MNSKKDENFFGRLRRTAIDVKKQSVELQAIIEKPHSEKESSNVSAELTLRDMLKEIKNVNSDLRSKITELREQQDSFDDILAASKVVYHYQLKNYHQTESFLRQYGYKGKKKPEPKSKSPVEDDAAEGDKENQKPCSVQNQIHKKNIVEEPKETEVFKTPPRSQNPEKNELSTPKLEDFGLSRTTMMQLARMRNPDLCINAVNDNSGFHGTCTDRTQNDHNAPMSLPPDDTTITLSGCVPMVTAPDVHNGTLRKCATPRNQILRVEDELSTPKLEDFGLSREALDLISGKETPALYNTPAATTVTNVHCEQRVVNQHQYTHLEVQPPDALNHSGILMTPGLWGGKHTPTETPEPSQRGAFGKLSAITSIDFGSPVPPVFMTPGMKQMKGKQSLPQFLVESTLMKEEESKVTPTAPELQSYIKSAPTRTPSPLMVAIVNAEDEPEPDTPEFTTWIQEPERLVKESTRDIELSTPLSSVAPSGHQTNNDHHHKTKARTGIPRLTTIINHQSRPVGRYISPITQQEYGQTNDYLQRILSFQQLNEVVNKINELASNNGSGGHYIRSRELDLLELGPHTNVLMLLLVRLQRISMERKTPNGDSALYIL